MPPRRRGSRPENGARGEEEACCSLATQVRASCGEKCRSRAQAVGRCGPRHSPTDEQTTRVFLPHGPKCGTSEMSPQIFRTRGRGTEGRKEEGKAGQGGGAHDQSAGRPPRTACCAVTEYAAPACGLAAYARNSPVGSFGRVEGDVCEGLCRAALGKPSVLIRRPEGKVNESRAPHGD